MIKQNKKRLESFLEQKLFGKIATVFIPIKGDLLFNDSVNSLPVFKKEKIALKGYFFGVKYGVFGSVGIALGYTIYQLLIK